MNLTHRIKRRKNDTTRTITASANMLRPFRVCVANGAIGKTLKIPLVADLGRTWFISPFS